MAACATMSAVNFELDLDFLTVEERQTILAVLQRDEDLRTAEQERKRALKNEIAQLRQQSAVRVGAQQKSRQCSRCHRELGILFKKGEVCLKCKHQICMNCRVTIGESAAYSWLCTLCYKQRLLPAVAGDWFYSKIEENHRHDIQSLHGSDVVRSSIRRLSAPNIADRSRSNSGAEIRNNPFTNSSVPEASLSATTTSTTDMRSNNRSKRSAVMDPDTFVHHRVVRTVRSKGLRDSSDSSDTSSSDSEVDRERDNSLHGKIISEMLQSSSDTGEDAAAAVRLAPVVAGAETTLAVTADVAPGMSAQMSRSAEEFGAVAGDAEHPSSLLSIGASRERSKSAVENKRLGGDDADEVEKLTQVKFRKCSTGAVNEDAARLDNEDPQKADCGFGSGGGSGTGSSRVVGNVALSNTNASNASAVEYVRSISTDSTTSEDSLRRRLPLTPELDRKSPMIGRRELDISKKFLKSFSDDSSSEDDTLDREDMFDTEELNRYALDMPKVERTSLHPKLSVIREEGSPGTSPVSETKERKKLKLVINPKDFESPVSGKTDSSSQETPVTPGKYSSNWDDLSASPHPPKLSKTSSWSSSTHSAEIPEPKGNISTDEDSDPGNFSAQDLSSPRPVLKKKVVKKKAKNKESQSNAFASPHTSPSSEHLTHSSPCILADPSLHLGTSDFYNSSSPLVSGGFDVLGLGVTDPSANQQRNPMDEQERLPIHGAPARSEELVSRPSVDGCSQNSEEKHADDVTKRKLSDVPQLALSPPPNIDVSLADGEDDECHSLPDEFEEDIDNIVAEAKARTGSKMSSHLTVSMESITSVFSEAGADYTKHEITGDIQFSLSYVKKTGVLTLTVHRCKDLVAVHKKKKDSDPYVKAYLVSGNQKFNKRKTKVKKSTVNPEYEETFRYTLGSSDMHTKTLQLSVWSYNRISQGDFMGEVNIPLNSYPFDKNSVHPEWYPLGSKVAKVAEPVSETSAELRVSLRYVPIPSIKTKGAKAELYMKVLCARHLPTKKSGMSDPFVKCVMLPDKVKHKTAVVRNNLNPVWDETFTFSKSSNEEFEESSLDISVIDHDRFSSNDVIGTVQLNLGRGTSFGKKVDWMKASGAGKLLWETVMNNPGEWVNQWVPLSL